ncbi:MAG: phospho-N-acetylmuramoyl-pentapeptide-transferase [bacterium]|nr:phospho-N-acetylmuramoyl-pentapeptide-transferase [bacterium]
MLYHLLYPLTEYFSLFNLFQYVTFRSAYAAVTAFLLVFFIGKPFIAFLKRRTIEERIREDTPDRHQSKAGTPTMGGVLIVVGTLVPTLLWADIKSPCVWMVVGITFALGLLGFFDDWLKVVKKKPLGLLGRYKFITQAIFAFAIGTLVYLFPLANGMTTVITFPFFKELAVDIGLFYIVFVAFTITATTNAVNLTDGLDGLAAGSVLFAAGAFGIICYVTSHAYFADYLDLMQIIGTSELVIFCAAMVGAIMGFLWFNSYPAQIFMGDTGSLALGGGLGTVAILAKQELTLVFIGGIFVIETVSVISQVAYFKLTGGKRIFRMSPLHHHYELLGLDESKIVVRFWIIAAIFAVIGLSTLKLR